MNQQPMHWNQLYVGSRFLFTRIYLWRENGGNSNQAHRQLPGMLQQNSMQGIDMMRIGYRIGAQARHEFTRLMQRECDALKEDAHQAAEVLKEASITNHRGKK